VCPAAAEKYHVGKSDLMNDPSKRDFLKSISRGLPMLGVGAAGILAGCSSARGSPQLQSSQSSAKSPQPPIYVASQFGTSPAAVAEAIETAGANNQGLVFESGITFTIDSTVLDADVSAIPAYVLGYGATLTASQSASGTLLAITNPQDSAAPPGSSCFMLAGLNINGDGRVQQTLAINGSQFARYQDLTCTGSSGTGIIVSGAPGKGSYTNEFTNVLSTNNGGAGWYITTASGQSVAYNAGNTFLNCSSQYNGSYGWTIDQANNTYVGCDAEDNTAAGFNIVRTVSSVFIGGYSENNPNTNPGDQSFALAGSSSAGVVVIGGRHSGAISGSVPGNGNVFLIYWQSGDRGFVDGYVPFGCDDNGLVSVRELGLANTVAAASTPSGPTASAIPVFDANGNALGYVPVYKSLW
jgi:hypothetical protein